MEHREVLKFPVGIRNGEPFFTELGPIVHLLIAGGPTVAREKILSGILTAAEAAEDLTTQVFDLALPPGDEKAELGRIAEQLEKMVEILEARYKKLAEESMLHLHEYRNAGHNDLPFILICLKNADQANWKDCQRLRKALLPLLAKGRTAGIHIVASVSDAASAFVSDMYFQFPGQLLFRIPEKDSRFPGAERVAENEMLYLYYITKTGKHGRLDIKRESVTLTLPQ